MYLQQKDIQMKLRPQLSRHRQDSVMIYIKYQYTTSKSSHSLPKPISSLCCIIYVKKSEENCYIALPLKQTVVFPQSLRLLCFHLHSLTITCILEVAWGWGKQNSLPSGKEPRDRINILNQSLQTTNQKSLSCVSMTVDQSTDSRTLRQTSHSTAYTRPLIG